MEKSLQAVYRDGVLQLLESVPLEEKQQVTVTISDPTNFGQDIAGFHARRMGGSRPRRYQPG
jgi:predicted DNA-binding antitoxin AbrB/MazE fold protein